jgi:regulator of sigma E protease
VDFIGLLPDFGNLLYTVAAFVLALAVIVTVHEFGHYFIGRISGIRAEVFSFGFGPRLAWFEDRHGTRWQISAIPLGGYVKFLGDANAASASADAKVMAHLTADERRMTMHGAPVWARAATVAAGPVFNFILSIAIFAGMFLWTGTPTDQPTVGTLAALPAGSGEIKPGDRIVAIAGFETPDYTALAAVVDQVPGTAQLDYLVERGGAQMLISGPALFPARLAGIGAGSAAADAGLQPGDVVLRADGTDLVRFGDLQQAVTQADGAEIALSVWRPGPQAGAQGAETLAVTLTPRRTDLPLREGGFESRLLIGASGDFFFTPATRPTGMFEAAQGAVSETWFIAKSSLSGMWHMVTGAISSCNLRGPIGIAEVSAQAAATSAQSFIWFIAVLSTAVGLLNLFPIPVLDGGHLVFHAWEAATGKPPAQRVLNVLITLGLVLVLSLMVFGLSNDIFCP